MVTYGRTLPMALQAAEQVAAEGVDAEVLDLRSLHPYDWDAIKASVLKTNRVLFLNEDTEVTNFGEHLLRRTVEELFYELHAPPRLLAGAHVPGVGLADALERASVPQMDQVATGDARARAARGVRAASSTSLGRLLRRCHLHRRQHFAREPVPHGPGPLELVARRDGDTEHETRSLPGGVRRVGGGVLVAHAERCRPRDQRFEVCDLAAPRLGSRRFVLDRDLEGVDVGLRPVLERLSTRAGRRFVVHVNDEATDDGVVVLAVPERHQALHAPELHARPMLRVRQSDAQAALVIEPPPEATHP